MADEELTEIFGNQKSPEQLAKEEAAAIRIQSVTRMHAEQEAYLDKQHAATDIQKIIRGKQERQKKTQQEEAAIKIQGRIRQKEAKERVRILREEKVAQLMAFYY